MTPSGTTPALRFGGFPGEWEEKPLDGAFSFEVSNNTLSRAALSDTGRIRNIHYGDVLIRFGSVLDVSKEAVPFVADRDFRCTGQNRLHDGDLVMADTAEDETAGKVTEIRGSDGSDVVAGLHTIVLRPLEDHAPGFLGYAVNAPSFHERVVELLQGTKVLSINKTALMETSLVEPSDLTEQRQIGSFFRELDALIAGREKALGKLEALKKAMLLKMFPQDGAKVPEVRFKGFEGEWEEKKLGAMADIVGGGTPSTTVPEFWDGDINWFSPTEIGETVFVSQSARRITRAGLQNSSATILPAEKTILFTSRATIGEMAILKQPATTNQGFQSFVVHSDVDVYFLFSCQPFIAAWAIQHAHGSTFLEISKGSLENMMLRRPSLPEQQKIGTFFRSLDTTISARRKELEKLRQLKAGLLERMFA